MATTNLINILYRVNTQDLRMAEQLLKQVDAANDKLKQGFQSGGQQIRVTLDGMKSRLDTLRAALRNTATDNVAQIRKLSAEYKNLDAAIKRIEDDYYRVATAADASSAATKKLTLSISQMTQAVQAYYSAGLLRQILDTALAASELAGKIEGVSRAYYNQIPQATVLMDKLRRSTHGTLTELELMQYAIRAQNFKIPLEDLGNLLEFAMLRAQQTGESIDYMVNSIITGLGRDSIKILDNLQVDVGAMKKEMDELGISIDEAFGNQVEKELIRMGGYIETQADKVAKLKTEWENVKATLATRLSQSWLMDFLTQAVQGMQGVIKAIPDFQAKFLIPFVGGALFLKEFGENLKQVGIEMAVQADAMARYNLIAKDFGTDAEKNFLIADRQMVQNIKLRNQWEEEKKALEEKIEVMREDGAMHAANIERAEQTVERLDFQIRSMQVLNKLLFDYIKAQRNVNAVDKEQLGIIEEMEKKIASIEELRKKSTSLDMIRSYNDQLKLQRALLQEILDMTNQYDKNASKVYDLRLRGALPGPKTAPKAPGMNEALAGVSDVVDRQRNVFSSNEALSYLEEVQLAFKAAQEDLIAGSVDITANALTEILYLEADAYQARIDNVKAFYDHQQLLAGDNQRRKKELALKEEKEISELRRQQAKKEQQARIFSIIIDTAASITKTAAQLGFPAAIPFIALAAVSGAVQLAIASRAQPKGFKKGVIGINEPGADPTRDSIPAILMPGESVMTTAETKSSRKILEGIRAGIIDDKVLDRLELSSHGVTMIKSDNRDIVEAIEANAVDYYNIGSTLYEHRESKTARWKAAKSKSI